MGFKFSELEATNMGRFRWAFRPKGQLGTCGWHPHPWEVVYVTAINEREAWKHLYTAAARQGRVTQAGVTP